MMESRENKETALNPSDELKRIFTMGVLALLLVALSLLLDGPVSLLAWLLILAALLCLVYILLASRNLMIHFRSLDHTTKSHD